MPRFAFYSPRYWLVIAAMAAVTGFGIVSESMAFGWDQPGRWAPDLLVGATFAGAACWVWPTASGAAGLLALTSVAWFAANVHPGPLLFWHRGTLIHLLLAYPGLWPRSRLALAGVGVGYAASIGGWWRYEAVTIVLSAAVAGLLLRAVCEHAFAHLKNWRILTKLRLDVRHATRLLRALLVLTNLAATR